MRQVRLPFLGSAKSGRFREGKQGGLQFPLVGVSPTNAGMPC